MSLDARARALSALTRFQVTEATVGDTLDQIAEITLDAISTAAVAGMTLLGEHGNPVTAIFTDLDSPEIDQAQYSEGRGPCLDAWRERRVIRIDDVARAADQYPAFSAACRDHDIVSTLSLPMLAGRHALGAMNLYARVPAAFGPSDEELGADIAGAAGAVLANVSAYWTAFELNQQLDEAMRTRAVIEQAKGMLMARSPALTPDEAFDLLRKASQRENVKLHDIARRVVERRLPSGRAERGPDA